MASANLEVQVSNGLSQWLHEHRLSIGFTTYQTNRLFMIGSKSADRLAVQERLFDRPMGLYWNDDRLILACRSQIWQFNNQLLAGERYQGADRLFSPKQSWVTGDHNTHEVAIDKHQRLLFVNSNFSCIATVSPDYSFEPVWQPPFISKLASEDRCHLNCFALVDGEPTYATACATTDEAAGWRNHTVDGGVVMHIPSNDIVATGLSMPHSPRWHHERLWLLNSGSGELGYIEHGRFQPVIFCPGFVRGLSFFDDHAFVGLSMLRSTRDTGLVLEKRLNAEKRTAQSGLMVIDLKTGNAVHWIHFPNTVEELFDVVVLRDVRYPKVLGFQNDDIERLISFPGSNGLVISKPTRPNHAAAATVTAPARQARDAGNVRFQRVYHLTPDNLLPYEGMACPSLRARWKTQPQRGELFGVSADIGGEMIGFGVAERVDADCTETVELISLFVVADCRNRGIGRRIVIELGKSAGHAISNRIMNIEKPD